MRKKIWPSLIIWIFPSVLSSSRIFRFASIFSNLILKKILLPLTVKISNQIPVKSLLYPLFSFWQTTTDSSIPNDFHVYWNVPTFMCHKYGMFFEEVSEEFGIRQNDQDQFRGDEIFILYDPGYFPALLKDENGKKQFFEQFFINLKKCTTFYVNILSYNFIRL